MTERVGSEYMYGVSQSMAQQINNILRTVEYNNALFCNMIDATFIQLYVKFQTTISNILKL